jgi:hypothetical protein
MEHLIPVDQCTNDIIDGPDIDNVKSLYEKQRIVIMLRSEKKEYEGSNSSFGKGFKTYRTDENIKQFYSQYKIKPV